MGLQSYMCHWRRLDKKTGLSGSQDGAGSLIFWPIAGMQLRSWRKNTSEHFLEPLIKDAYHLYHLWHFHTAPVLEKNICLNIAQTSSSQLSHEYLT